MGASAPMRKVHVLAVDDQRPNLLAIDAVLGDECDVTFATSGPDAIAILGDRAQHFDVILMDLQMPGMDGFEAATRIKQLPGCEDIPIVFITAIYKEEPFMKRGYEIGGVDYFTKPFDPLVLRKKIAIYGSFRQKTDILRQRERELQETENLLAVGRKLSAVLESLPVGVLIADVHGGICQTNDEAARICRVSDAMRRDAYGEVLGWWDADGRMIRSPDGPLSKAIEAGKASHNQILHVSCADGTKKTLLGSTSPLFGPAYEIVGAVIVLQDFTEPKKIERDFEQRVASLISAGLGIEQTLKPQRPS